MHLRLELRRTLFTRLYIARDKKNSITDNRTKEEKRDCSEEKARNANSLTI